MLNNIGSNLDRELRVRYSVAQASESHGLSADETSTLQRIAVGERTWIPAETLARAGLNGVTLAGLVASNWVEEFLTEDGLALTFSPWAAEVLGLDQEERWEVHPGVAEQEDNSGERTRMPVREPHEIPRWSTRPPPREPGMPRPKQVPLKLPFLFRLSRLPEEVIQGLLARTIADPVEEAMANEERERYLEREARTETGQLDVDPESGQVRIEPVLLWPPETRDGLRGGVADPHVGKIPIDARLGAKGRPRGKKKRRRRRRH